MLEDLTRLRKCQMLIRQLAKATNVFGPRLSTQTNHIKVVLCLVSSLQLVSRVEEVALVLASSSNVPYSNLGMFPQRREKLTTY
eukprot:scaffold2003_cov224-Alexandrium_tamarense.AAC.3